MLSSDGRLAIVFNGEIYSYRLLREVISLEHAFRTQSDTEVLLAAFAGEQRRDSVVRRSLG